MRNVSREAKKDAFEYAAATMSYGEGAGIRRKLINETIRFKADRIPGYLVEFEKQLDRQDTIAHIKSANRKSRNMKIKGVVNRNVKGIVRGDISAISTPLIVGAFTYYVLHKTGYDRLLWDKTKRKGREFKRWVKRNLS